MLSRYNITKKQITNYTTVSFLSGLGIINYWYLYPNVVERNKQQIKLILDKTNSR